MNRREVNRSIWDRIWRNDHGDVVIWQFPNWPLWAWAGLTLVSLFFTGKTADVFSWAASAALIYWSLLELFRGDNYFRRLLGAVVFGFSAMSVIRLIGG